MKVKVFVYGTLKKDMGNHILLKDSTFLGADELSNFRMHSLGAYPAVCTVSDGSIFGEVYEVDEPTLARLDRLEGYPHYYNRKEVVTSYGPAWIYYQKSEELKVFPVVKDGVWERNPNLVRE